MVCDSCNKTIKMKSVTCEHCTANYHPSCTTLKPVWNKNNTVVNACRSCISVANANTQRRDFVNKNNSNDHSTVTNFTPKSFSASCSNVPISSSDPLHQKLEKFIKLESFDASLDKRFTEMQASFDTRVTEVKTTLNTRLEEVSTRMTNLEERLCPLDILPLLATGVLAALHHLAICQVQSEQGNLRR